MYNKFDHTVNIQKTKYTTVEEIHLGLILEEGIGTTAHTEEYKYLGVNVTSCGEQDMKITEKINKLGKVDSITRKWHVIDTYVTKETETKIFKPIKI